MPDPISPYGVTQNPDAEMITADQMVGERSDRVIGNAVFGSAAGFSTAPYRPDIIGGRRASRIGKCKGKGDSCGAPPIRSSDLCIFHTPQDPA